MKTKEECARFITDTLYADSHIRVSVTDVAAVLARDLEYGNVLPTEEECEQLIMGDNEGEAADDFARRFKHLNEFIMDQY